MADRYPAWSPDGKQIAWFNDDGGEYGLVIADQEGRNPRRIDIPGNTFYYRPAWSPDGKQIAFTDTDFRVRVVDVAPGKVTDVDGEEYANPRRTMDPVWSPDSRCVAYTKRLDNLFRAVLVYDTRERRGAPAHRRHGRRASRRCGTPRASTCTSWPPRTSR